MFGRAILSSLFFSFCLFHLQYVKGQDDLVNRWKARHNVTIGDYRYLNHYGKDSRGDRYVLYITFNPNPTDSKGMSETIKNFMNMTETHFPENKPPFVNGFQILSLFALEKPKSEDIPKEMSNKEGTLEGEHKDKIAFRSVVGIHNMNEPYNSLWRRIGNRAKKIVAAFGEDKDGWDQKWMKMINDKEKSVAKWVIDYGVNKAAYLDKSNNLMLFGNNATDAIHKVFIEEKPLENSTSDGNNNSTSSNEPTNVDDQGTAESVQEGKSAKVLTDEQKEEYKTQIENILENINDEGKVDELINQLEQLKQQLTNHKASQELADTQPDQDVDTQPDQYPETLSDENSDYGSGSEEPKEDLENTDIEDIDDGSGSGSHED